MTKQKTFKNYATPRRIGSGRKREGGSHDAEVLGVYQIAVGGYINSEEFEDMRGLLSVLF